MELEKVKVSQLPQVESLEQNDRALILRSGNSEDDIPFDATAPLGSLLNLVQQLQQIVSEQSTTIATLTQKVEGFQGSLQTLIPVDTENIADGAVTGGKIADSTVTSQNIDWATFKVNPKYNQTGITTVPLLSDGVSGSTINVTFPVPFDNVPNVQATLVYAGATVSGVTITNVQKTGFTAIARSTYSQAQGDRPVYWEAKDLSAVPFIPSDQEENS